MGENPFDVQHKYILLDHDRYNHSRHEVYQSKARGKWECSSLCKVPTFPIAKLLTTWDKTPMRVYVLEHKQKGLARCRKCDYITATPIKMGARCPCCRNKFSRTAKFTKVRIEDDPLIIT